MMKKLKTLLILLLAVSVLGCKTITVEPELPDDLAFPSLIGDNYSDIIELVGQDIRWRLWASEVRWILGIITDEEYEEQTKYLLSLLGDD